MTPALEKPAADRRTRVLYCERNVDGTIGGSYYSLLYLIQRLKGSPYGPVAVFHREHRLLSAYAEACEEVHVMPQPPAVRLGKAGAGSTSPLRIAQRGLNLGRMLNTARGYAAFLRGRGIKLVHLNNSVTGSHEWMLAAVWTRTPCVVHERGMHTHLSRLTRLLAPRLAAVICISGAVQQNLIEQGISAQKLRTIYNGLDPDLVVPGREPSSVRRSLGIEDDRRVVGLIGNIKEWKGQEVLLRALPAIAERIPAVTCLFVGATADQDRYYEARLHRLVLDLGLERHVIFSGEASNVADFLQVMEIVVHTSVAPEPFGRVLLEAMAMRKPVVGSHDGAVPEIVEHGVTGYTFPPSDSSALAERVGDLLLRRDLARTMGEVGRERLEQRFSLARNVSSTLSLYRSLLGSPAADAEVLFQR